MSAKRKVNMPLTQNGVITEEAMLAYLNGMLTPEDTAKFEQLVADDPFAREALEGLQATTIPKLKDTFEEIHSKVAERSGAAQPENSISLTVVTRYAVAAVLIGLLVGMAFLITNYINKQTPTLAMETQQEEQAPTEARPLMEEESENPIVSTEPSMQTDTEFVTSNTGTVVSRDTFYSTYTVEDNGSGTNVTSENKGAVTSKQVVVLKQDQLLADKKADERRKAEQTNKEAAKKASAVNSTLTVSGNAAAGTPAPATSPSRAERNEQGSDLTVVTASKAKGADATDVIAEDGDSEMEVAMESFNSRNYKNASKLFNKVLDKDPNNTDAIYFNSVSEFINGNNNKALKGFDKLLEKSDKHIDGSKYYKAQILLKKGKQEEARYLFDQVSKGNSSFKQRAAEKLEEIR